MREKITDYNKWLEDSPTPEEISEIITEVNGKKLKWQFIPVFIIEDLLDWFTDKHWDSNSFKFSKYDVDGKEYVSGSLELTVSFDGFLLTRTGAATSSVEELKAINESLSERENTAFEATILSLALCNAAKKLGNRFGRSLNGRGVGKSQSDNKEMSLPIPDKKIIEQYLKAVEDGNIEKQKTFLLIYDNQTLHNAVKI